MQDPFEVKSPEVEALLRDIGHAIGGRMPKGMGFMLMLFDFGENGATFYISSAQRADMLKAMKEFIEKQEAK